MLKQRFGRGLLGLGLCLMFALGCTIVVSATTRPIYRAQMMIGANPDAFPLALAASAIIAASGLNSLPGTGLDTLASPFVQFEASLRSLTLARHLATPRVLSRTVAPAMDPGTGRVDADNGIMSILRALFSLPVEPKPGAHELQDFIARAVVLKQTQRPGIMTLSFEHEDPEFASAFLRAVVLGADDVVKAQVLSQNAATEEALKQALSQATEPQARATLIATLSDQRRQSTFAKRNIPFTILVFDDAATAPTPTTANRPLIFTMALTPCLVVLAIWLVWKPGVAPLLRRPSASDEAALERDLLGPPVAGTDPHPGQPLDGQGPAKPV